MHDLLGYLLFCAVLTAGGWALAGLMTRVYAAERTPLSPVFDPVSQLVYAAGREHVQHVWIDGRHVVRKRQLTDDAASVAVSELVGRTALWHNRTGEILSG